MIRCGGQSCDFLSDVAARVKPGRLKKEIGYEKNNRNIIVGIWDLHGSV